MKILIVEDSRATLLIVSKFVERFGAQPICTENGEQAIAAFQREQPDITGQKSACSGTLPLLEAL